MENSENNMTSPNLEYKLYQEQTLDVAPEVVNYFNGLTNKTKLSYSGLLPLAWKDTPPYNAKSIAVLPPELENNKEPIIVLTNAYLQMPMDTRNNFALLGHTPFLMQMELMAVHYWTYFCAISLLKLESRREFTIEPENWKIVEPKAIESEIKEGGLLLPDYKALEILSEKDPLLFDLTNDIKTVVTSIANAYKGSGVRMAPSVSLVYADPEKRRKELESYRFQLIGLLEEQVRNFDQDLLETAWDALVEADGAISKSFMNRIELFGYDSIIGNFIKTLGETKNLKSVPFLKKLESEEKLTNLQIVELKHSLENLNTSTKVEPELIGIAPPAGVTEHKRPKDALGYKVFSNALGDLVCHKSTTTPLTIGICARWGRGKSVLLNYIKDRIDELVGTENFVDCVCIDFNAWKYTKSEQLWAEFYTKVLDGVESDLSWWGKTRFRAYFLRRNNPKLYYSTYWGAGFTVFASFLLWYFYQQPLVLQFALKLQWGELISFWTPIGAFIATTFPFIWKRTRSVPKQIFWKSHLPKFREALGVQHEIFKSFQIVCDWLGTPEKKRIVVFIDDIDRCQPDEILQVIESIKLLLDSQNFVFVLAMDPKIVRHAIGKSYEFISKKKTEKERLGREYLEKIIQIPFHLPQLTYKELSRLKNQLFAVSDSPDTFEGKVIAPQVTRDDPGEFQVDPELVTGGDADDKLSPDKTPVISPIGDDSEPFDSKLSVEFSKSESSDIDLLLKDNYVISPRLLYRLKNTYLLAKHFYISEHNSDPPSELIKLLAFSIKYPFESVDIFETMEYESKNKYWASIANACYKQNDEEFNSNIYKMILMLKKHVPDIDVARNLSKYVNYFNITAS